MDNSIIKKKFSGKDRKKLIWLAVAGALGVLLVILGSLSGSSKNKNTDIDKEDTQTEAYIASIENKIRNITEQITGDSNVCVIVTVKTGVESVYVCDSKTSGDGESLDYITVKNSGGDSSLVIVKQIYPEISGVSVACRGGDGAAVQAKLIMSISTALGIPSNRICIIGTK